MDGTRSSGGSGRHHRSRSGRMAAAALLVTLAAAAPARVSAAAERLSFLPTPAGPVLLVLPAEAATARRPWPVVLALPDMPGPDGRGRSYLEALNAAGVATIEFVPSGGDDGPAPRRHRRTRSRPSWPRCRPSRAWTRRGWACWPSGRAGAPRCGRPRPLRHRTPACHRAKRSCRSAPSDWRRSPAVSSRACSPTASGGGRCSCPAAAGSRPRPWYGRARRNGPPAASSPLRSASSTAASSHCCRPSRRIFSAGTRRRTSSACFTPAEASACWRRHRPSPPPQPLGENVRRPSLAAAAALGALRTAVLARAGDAPSPVRGRGGPRRPRAPARAAAAGGASAGPAGYRAATGWMKP